jgi:hypothetical protein
MRALFGNFPLPINILLSKSKPAIFKLSDIFPPMPKGLLIFQFHNKKKAQKDYARILLIIMRAFLKANRAKISTILFS